MTEQQRMVLARKWRPKNFQEVIGQEFAVRALSNALDNQFLHHAYLFTGTRGVGKTTIARILSKCLNCETGVTSNPCGTCESCTEISQGRFPDLFEVDAASRTKVEDTREILENVQYAPVKGRFKIYLIDEVHMLSGHSFNALLKTLEEPPEHVKFLLATTDPQKLPATVLSRCLQFHLSHMTPDAIAEHLSRIVQQEKINAESEALDAVAHAANGSMRDALSLMDQVISFSTNEIKVNDVQKMLGAIDHSNLTNLLSAIAEGDSQRLMDSSEQIKREGADYENVLRELLSLLHQISLFQLSPTLLSPKQIKKVESIASKIPPEDVQLYYQITLIGQRDLVLAPSQQVGFEMIMIRMLTFSLQQWERTPSEPNLRSQTPATTTPKATKIAPTVSTHQTGSTPQGKQWLDLIKQLNLGGATGALLRACAMESLTENQLCLALSPSHEPLLNKNHISRINDALQHHFQSQIEVIIQVKDSTQPTATKTQQDCDTQAIDKAEKSLLSDSNVQKIMKDLHANIAKDSITTHNE